MSKPVKNLIVESYKQRFADVSGAVVIDIRGIGANDNNRFRHGLAQKQIKVTIVKNSLARRAFDGTGLVPLGDLLEGSAAMVYPHDGDVSVVGVARELIEWTKQIDSIEFKGALMEGMVFGPNEIEALSKYPTREEAQGQVVQLVLSPAQNLVGAVLGPGRMIASLVKAIEEKLEEGETIKAAA